MKVMQKWKMRSMKVSAPTWQYTVAIKNEKHLQTQPHLDVFELTERDSVIYSISIMDGAC